MLAMCIGLTACGGSNASSSTASSSKTASGATATDTILYWEGTLSDGSIVDLTADPLNGLAAVSVAKSDYSDAAVWFGTASVASDGVVTITDAETSHPIKLTPVSVAEDSMNIDVEDYGEVTLKPITESEFKAYAEKVAATPEGKKLKKEIKSELKKIEKRVAKQAQKLVDEFNSLDDSTVFFSCFCTRGFQNVTPRAWKR